MLCYHFQTFWGCIDTLSLHWPGHYDWRWGIVSFASEGLSSLFALYGMHGKDAQWGSWHIRFLLAKRARRLSGSGSQWVILRGDPSGRSVRNMVKKAKMFGYSIFSLLLLRKPKSHGKVRYTELKIQPLCIHIVCQRVTFHIFSCLSSPFIPLPTLSIAHYLIEERVTLRF